MLLVDDRIGSKDMVGPLVRYGVPAEASKLDFGDFAFIGKGINGVDVMIGIELKRIGGGERSDLVTSMYSTRFAGHQLLGMVSAHGMYDRAWLITEGIWRASDGGVLESMSHGWRPVMYGNRAVMANDVESWILTQVIRGGMLHWHCSTRDDTVRFLSVLYHWWTSKELQEHRSHQQIYQAPPDRASMVPPSDFVKGLVGLVPNIGWERAHAVEAHFERWGRMSAASPKQLMEVPGIGKVLAASIRKALE